MRREYTVKREREKGTVCVCDVEAGDQSREYEVSSIAVCSVVSE